MAYGIVHACAGVIIQSAGTPYLSVPLAFLSHWPLDDLNVGVWRIYHDLGGPAWKGLFIATQAIVWGILAWWLWLHPIYIIGVMAACIWDVDHLIPWDMKLHRNMFPAWLRTPKGLIVWVVVFALLLGVIWL